MKAIDISWWNKLSSQWKQIFIDNYNIYYGKKITLGDVNNTVLYYVAYMQRINCDGYGITSLAPLSQLLYLKTIYCNNNRIKSLSPLINHVYLESISLDNNKVCDLSPLENLLYLHHIYVRRNNICKLSPLLNIHNLWYVSLHNNPLDLTELEYVKSIGSFNLDN